MGQKNYGRLGDRPAERREFVALLVGAGAGAIAFAAVFVANPHFDGGHLLVVLGVSLVAWLATRLLPL